MSNFLFYKGLKINHHGQPLEIQQYLSSGLTGEVSLGFLTLADGAQVKVAVKVLKTREFPMAKTLFYQEGETLALLQGLEQNEDEQDELDPTLKIAPIYYGLNEISLQGDDSIPYLVMEFVQGKQVPDLLREQGPFSEEKALVVAWHLYRILHLLHENLLKSFIDLKFEDLWWVDDAGKRGGGQLKMTDFGTLEDIKPEQRRGIERDLLLGGVYFFALMTGRVLGYSFGELKELAEPLIEQQNRRISWGTRYLLRRVLHRNPEARLKSAKEVLDIVRQLVEFWTIDLDDLHIKAQKFLLDAETRKEMNSAVFARAAFDILRLREEQMYALPMLYKEQDMQRAQELLDRSDYLQRGLALLQGRSYTLARQVFEEGMSFVETPAVLRHWSYVAQIGEEIPPDILEARLEELKSILKHIHENVEEPKAWNSARRDLTKLDLSVPNKSSVLPKGLGYLLVECEIYENYHEARRLHAEEKFGEAAQRYAQIQDILDRELQPWAVKQIQEELGNIAEERRNADLQRTIEGAKRLYREAQHILEEKQIEQYDKVVGKVKQAVEQAPYAPFHINMLTGLIEQVLGQMVQDAQGLDVRLKVLDRLVNESGFFYSFDESPSSLGSSSRFSCLTQLAIVLRALFDQNEDVFCDKVREVHYCLGEQGDILAGLVLLAAQKAIESNHLLFLRRVIQLARERFAHLSMPIAKWEQDAEDLKHNLRQKRHEKINELFDEIERELLLILPSSRRLPLLKHRLDTIDERPPLQSESQRLIKARAILDALKRLQQEDPDDTDIAEIGKKIQDWEGVVQELERNCTNPLGATGEATGDVSLRIEEIKKDRQALEHDFEAYRRDLSTRPTNFVPKLLGLWHKVYNLLDHLNIDRQNGRAWAADQFELLNSTYQWIKETLDELGIEAWKKVAHEAQTNHDELYEKFREAKDLFEAGNDSEALSLLEAIPHSWAAGPEWKGLKEKISEVRQWREWHSASVTQNYLQQHEYDADFLSEIRNWVEPPRLVPGVYWSKTQIPNYLNRLAESAKCDIQIKKKDIASEAFFETLRRFLDIHWTKALLEAVRAPNGISPLPAEDWQNRNRMEEVYRWISQDRIEELCHQALVYPPQDPEKALENWQLGIWKQVTRLTREKTSWRKRVLFPVRALVGLVVVGTVAFLLSRYAFPAVPFLGATATPIVTETPAPLIVTPTNLPTSTPAEPTAIPVTPTPIPESTYRLSPQLASSLTPLPPVINDDATWLIDDTQAFWINQGDTQWKPLKDESKENKEGFWHQASAESPEKFFYTTKGNVVVWWSMDQPFAADGYYQVFVADTANKSENLPLQKYEVFLDDVPVLPDMGEASVTFLSNTQQQSIDVWRSVGIYTVKAGQRMSVSVTVPDLTQSKNAFFAADRILIVRLKPEMSAILEKLKQTMPAGGILASLLDDKTAELHYEKDRTGNLVRLDEKKDYTISSLEAWNGEYIRFNVQQDKGYLLPLYIRWTKSLAPLPPGKYQVYLWIPDVEANAPAECKLKIGTDQTSSCEQSSHLQWMPIFAEPAAVTQEQMTWSFQVTFQDKRGILAADVIAIVRLP